MPSSLELANQILRRERALRTYYSQLENSLEYPRYLRTVQNLRNLQARQISLLSSLVDALESEQPPVPAERFYAQHIVQMGETLQMLAIMYNVTVSDIRRLNPGLPDSPQPGQLVTLPIEIPRPPRKSLRYYVQRGDTLFRIARRYNTDVETLVRLNSIANPDVIFPGRILIVPVTE